MILGYVMSSKRGGTDRLLSDFAEHLMRAETRLSGVVQFNTECADSHLCDMDVRVLPDGPVFRISQSLGTEARGCRLDPGALESAVGAVEKTLTPDTELLILNKFGKHEAGGRGFRDLIAHALAEDIPVLVGLSRMNVEAFQAFAAEMAVEVPADVAALDAWFKTLSGNPQRAA